MAFPTVLVNSATGSDTAASGAGPGTAISGSTGRTRNTAAQLRFGFFGATDDFSGVAVDGSAVCYMAIATAAARNHSSIAAIKNTRETGSDGAITTGTAVLVVGSTTGWSVGDVIKVTGAGAASADLYSTILTVDSGIQATLNDNAGTTVAAAAWENPKHATLTTAQGVNTGATNTAWAIGGKRASIGGTNSAKLIINNNAAGDAMPGWILEMESGHSESSAGDLSFKRAGNVTDGPITLRGTSGAATLPLLTFTNNGTALRAEADGIVFKGFELRNSNATKTASIGIVASAEGSISTVTISHSTNKFWKAISNIGSSSDGMLVTQCNIGFCANVGIQVIADTEGAQIITSNYIHDCGSHGIHCLGGIASCVFAWNILDTNAGSGIVVVGQASDDRLVGSNYIGNVFYANAAAGLLIGQTGKRTLGLLQILNNIFMSNGTYGINFSGSPTAQRLADYFVTIANNDFYLNTSGKYTPSGLTSDGEQTVDPGFTDAPNGDFRIGTALKALGFPTLTIGNAGLTQSYVDIGAAQRQESPVQVSTEFAQVIAPFRAVGY